MATNLNYLHYYENAKKLAAGILAAANYESNGGSLTSLEASGKLMNPIELDVYPKSISSRYGATEADFVIVCESDDAYEWKNRQGANIYHKDLGYGVITRIGIARIAFGVDNIDFIGESSYSYKDSCITRFEVNIEVRFVDNSYFVESRKQVSKNSKIKINIIPESKDREFSFDD